MTEPSQKDRVLAALRTNPRGITQVDFSLPFVIDGGNPITRVAARIEDLEKDGHRIVVAGERRDKCVVYRLFESVRCGAAPGPVEEGVLPSSAGGSLASPRNPHGLPEFFCCDRCGFTFHDGPWPVGCPNCKAHAHWLAGYHTQDGALHHVPLTPPEQAQAA